MTPQNSYVEVLAPSTSKRDCIWRENLQKVIKLKESPLDELLSDLTGVLYEEDIRTQDRHWGLYTQRKGHVRTEWEGGHLKATDRSLRRNQTQLAP